MRQRRRRTLKAIKGAREQEITAAYEMWQKAQAGLTIAKKSFDRIQNLYEKGVMSAQKRDEVEANYNAMVATEKAAVLNMRWQKEGARKEDKAAAAAMVQRAEGAIAEVESYVGRERFWWLRLTGGFRTVPGSR